MCPLCHEEPDTQEHILTCHKILEREPELRNKKYQPNDIFGKEYDQKEIVLTYIKALKVRDSMVLNENEHSLPGLQYWAQAHQDQQDQGGHGDQGMIVLVSRD